MRILMPAAVLLFLAACAADNDGDGFVRDDDCDDSDPEIHIQADEVCDGVDNDCDGTADEPDAIGTLPYWVDSDGDGYGDPDRLAVACEQPAGWAANDLDCNDEIAAINPGASEITGNGTDEDCTPQSTD